jgi:hypothetical protein
MNPRQRHDTSRSPLHCHPLSSHGRGEHFLGSALNNATSNGECSIMLEVQVDLASGLPTLVDTPVGQLLFANEIIDAKRLTRR